MDKKQFFDLCASHDWYYQYSDDYSIWEKYDSISRRIGEAIRENPSLIEILEDFRNNQSNNLK